VGRASATKNGLIFSSEVAKPPMNASAGSTMEVWYRVLFFREPLAVVVPFQLPQKCKDLWAEDSRIRHRHLPGSIVNLPVLRCVPVSLAKPARRAEPNRKWSPSAWGWVGSVLPGAEWRQSGKQQ
jgi:hypothetical protein